MRVLFLNHNVVDSGTFFRAFHFGKQLATRGHQVTLVTTSRERRLTTHVQQRAGIEIVEAPDLLSGRARTGWDPYNTRVRTWWLRDRQFDVVHAFDSRPAVIHPALAAVARSRALFVMDWADWWGRGGWIQDRSGWAVRTFFGPIETWYEESFRKRAHGTTVISSALGERSRAMGIDAARIQHIPFGCDGSTSGERTEARARLGLSDGAAIVLHVGVLTRGDYELLQQAFEIVRRRNADALLVIAGRTGLGVRAQNGITVTGPVDDQVMQDWLAAANVCVVPCRDTIGNRGRWPSKINGYLAAGRAVVMPRVGDVAELIERASAGWTTAPTVEGFANGMLSALSESASADAAGARGRVIADTELSWPRLTDRLENFYEHLRGLA